MQIGLCLSRLEKSEKHLFHFEPRKHNTNSQSEITQYTSKLGTHFTKDVNECSNIRIPFEYSNMISEFEYSHFLSVPTLCFF